nr:hypothetical protein [uncultured Lacibacter sp.]
MKKIIITLFLFTITYSSYSQTCEEREQELLQGFGAISATLVYNTYIAIGGQADGLNKSNTPEKVKELMSEQISLMSTLVESMERMIKNKTIKSEDDINYSKQLIEILKGLGKQAKFLADYCDSRSIDDIKRFEEQRKINWGNISKYMGLDS